ncbi:MAG: FtsX-like permease family protein [Candidatus Latescibacteria bacterium]|jgi:putative ABC transport system permease protein|nr:FtsX-like permease family protein [Candidatus Latescibacterota bacterium]
MKWKNLFKVAFKSLIKNRMRSILTSLGIIIGVGAVIIMVAIGEGAQAEIENQIASLGANLIIIFPGSSKVGGVSQGAGSYNRLTLDDVEILEKEAEVIQGISPMVQVRAQVIWGTNNWNTNVSGVSTDYLSIRNWGIESGNFFTERDVQVKSKVAVIGKTVADNLFPAKDPIGEKIRINNTPFKVVGVLSEKGQDARGQDQDDVVIAPSTTVLYRLSGGRYINMIYASAASVEQLPEAQEEISELLRDSHRLNPGEEDDFRILNQAEIMETVSETSKILTLLLGSIAGVSLIVGGIGIMNIMLVSVTERTREIGIRLAIGARGSDVLIQFLAEAVLLSMVGGFIGIVTALSASYVLNNFTGITTVVNPGIIMLAVVFSGVVGVFFGFYPARKAAALNPIDALRYE